jgi:hypothetical protein
MAEEIPLRITVVSPPPGVAFAVQLGRDGLLPPVRSTREELTFEFTLELDQTRRAATPIEVGRDDDGSRSEWAHAYLSDRDRAALRLTHLSPAIGSRQPRRIAMTRSPKQRTAPTMAVASDGSCSTHPARRTPAERSDPPVGWGTP